jgi:hypothetical protein
MEHNNTNLYGLQPFKKKYKFNLQFKMVSYLCTQLQEEKFELIATSS